jgi:hypothetical protein
MVAARPPRVDVEISMVLILLVVLLIIVVLSLQSYIVELCN